MLVNAFMGTLNLKTRVLCGSWYLNLSIIKGFSFARDFPFYYIDIYHQLLSIAKVRETVDIYLCSPSGPSQPVTGSTLPLPLFKYLLCYMQQKESAGEVLIWYSVS
jgi:hypothetical protein